MLSMCIEEPASSSVVDWYSVVESFSREIEIISWDWICLTSDGKLRNLRCFISLARR